MLTQHRYFRNLKELMKIFNFNKKKEWDEDFILELICVPTPSYLHMYRLKNKEKEKNNEMYYKLLGVEECTMGKCVDH